MSFGKFYSLLTRTKDVTAKTTESALHRCLHVCDLTFLGVGATVGAGLYVVTGQVAKNIAGPGIVLSFLIAAVASMLAGLCYAEFGCRISKSGSAYVYTYATLGEFWAFVIGWNMVLEYIIGNASLARGLSDYIDSIFGGAIKNFFVSHIGSWEVNGLGSYPDFLALLMPLVMATIVCMGVKHSTTFNKIVTFINMAVVVFVIGVGLWHVDTRNWTPRQSFAPYGASGILSGAASCFFCFVGFDVIATAGEETINPRRNIPMSMILSLLISFFCYFGVSTVLTMMVPFSQLKEQAPLATAFGDHAFKAAQYIITVGGLSALFGALLGGTFAVPRIIYSMAKDGLLFSYFAKVNQSTSTPARAIIAASVLAAILALVFDLEQLVEMLSIGTLMAYTMVAVSVIALRFQPGVESITDEGMAASHVFCCKANPDAFQDYLKMDTSSFLSSPPSTNNTTSSLKSSKGDRNDKNVPDNKSSFIATASLALIIFGIGGVSAVFIGAWANLRDEDPWAITTLTLSCVVVVMGIIIMVLQPTNNARFPFTVPCIPVLPLASIMVNIFLLLKLSYWTWVRFAVWLVIGLAIYFIYGIHNSVEGKQSGDNSGDEVKLIMPPAPDQLYDMKQIQPLNKKQTDHDDFEEFERYVEH